jgi:hypothetical protein
MGLPSARLIGTAFTLIAQNDSCGARDEKILLAAFASRQGYEDGRRWT